MPLSEDTEARMLAYVYGELDGDEARAFEARMAEDAELRAEVEGLFATRELLGVEKAHAEQAGLDEPPPHLLEAILRAEALARPPQIRDASLALERGAPESGGGGFSHKLSTWLLGGGLALGAAAALFVLVTQGEGPPEPAAIPLSKQEQAAPAPEGAAPAAAAAGAKDRKVGSAERPLGGREADLDADLEESAYRPPAAPEALEAEAPAEAKHALPGRGAGLVSPMDAPATRAHRKGAPYPSLSPRSGPPPIPAPLKEQLERQRAERAKKAPVQDKARARAERARLEQEVEEALAAGVVALQTRRPEDALDIFQRAALLDRALKKFGAAPYLGQMRAYLDLGRPAETYALLLLVRERANAPGQLAEGLMWAAEAAEALQRLEDAERLYEEARRYASTQRAAEKALDRLRQARARRKAAEPAAKSAGAAAEEP